MLRRRHPHPVLKGEARSRRVLEGELVLEPAHPPHDRPGLRVDLRDLAQAPKRHDQVPVAVEVERIAVRPVDILARAAGRLEVRDLEVIERVPLK